MSGTLSPTMAEALRRCVAARGLKYVRGGFWIEVTQDPAPFLRLGHAPQTARSDALPWNTTTHTIKALLKRERVYVERYANSLPAVVQAKETAQ